MSELNKKPIHWTICLDCKGQGKKNRGISKKAKMRYQLELELFEKADDQKKPIPPKSISIVCATCNGSGLQPISKIPNNKQEDYPHLAIIGGGIGGTALAVACLHRGIPFMLFERDAHFEIRSQGYGLTLQQASNAMKSLGILSLDKGIISTKHIVHTTDGKEIGTWGARSWLSHFEENPTKKTNIHIARQALRLALMEQLEKDDKTYWGHQFESFSRNENNTYTVNFKVDGVTKSYNTDLIIGADGIRSSVRKITIGESLNPLRFLDCMIILGICPLANLKEINHLLLDGATVFQTANGNERIYVMPFTKDSVMWQLSFPISEIEAKKLSNLGSEALKAEACRRTPWHDPIPQILSATAANQISGYPVYDRALLTPELLKTCGAVTLIGDAAHPMSPFKGQGANQALLDALSLARLLTKNANKASRWRESGLREKVLNTFETEMLSRTEVKVKGSAAAADFLHSNIVLKEGNQTRGSIKE